MARIREERKKLARKHTRMRQRRGLLILRQFPARSRLDEELRVVRFWINVAKDQQEL